MYTWTYVHIAIGLNIHIKLTSFGATFGNEESELRIRRRVVQLWVLNFLELQEVLRSAKRTCKGLQKDCACYQKFQNHWTVCGFAMFEATRAAQEDQKILTRSQKGLWWLSKGVTVNTELLLVFRFLKLQWVIWSAKRILKGLPKDSRGYRAASKCTLNCFRVRCSCSFDCVYLHKCTLMYVCILT